MCAFLKSRATELDLGASMCLQHWNHFVESFISYHRVHSAVRQKKHFLSRKTEMKIKKWKTLNIKMSKIRSNKLLRMSVTSIIWNMFCLTIFFHFVTFHSITLIHYMYFWIFAIYITTFNSYGSFLRVCDHCFRLSHAHTFKTIGEKKNTQTKRYYHPAITP